MGSVEEEGLEESEGGDDAGRAIGQGPKRFVVDVSLESGDLEWKRGTVDPWNLPSDSENELASPSEFPRESRSAGLCACSPGSSFYDEEGGRFFEGGFW